MRRRRDGGVCGWRWGSVDEMIWGRETERK